MKLPVRRVGIVLTGDIFAAKEEKKRNTWKRRTECTWLYKRHISIFVQQRVQPVWVDASLATPRGRTGARCLHCQQYFSRKESQLMFCARPLALSSFLLFSVSPLFYHLCINQSTTKINNLKALAETSRRPTFSRRVRFESAPPTAENTAGNVNEKRAEQNPKPSAFRSTFDCFRFQSGSGHNNTSIFCFLQPQSEAARNGEKLLFIAP